MRKIDAASEQSPQQRGLRQKNRRYQRPRAVSATQQVTEHASSNGPFAPVFQKRAVATITLSTSRLQSN